MYRWWSDVEGSPLGRGGGTSQSDVTSDTVVGTVPVGEITP